MGREVTLVEPETDADGFFPKGPASICIEGPPQRQCYTATEGIRKEPDRDRGPDVGRHVRYSILGRERRSQWLRNSVRSSSPWYTNGPEDFFSGITVSNQNQHAFCNDSAISDALIFLTADYNWGPDQGHYGAHRYIISSYVRTRLAFSNRFSYYLADQYMSIRKYYLEATPTPDILTAEKPESLARLKRVKAASDREKQGPK